MMAGPPGCVMIVAGEASGDHHGANLVRALRRRDPSLVFVGIGGEALREAGVRVRVDARTLAVVGITEVFVKLPGLLRGMSTAKGLLRDLRPDLLVLIDFPDFNLHLAKTARRLGIPVLYYISPQVWAWRSGRVRTVGRRTDLVATILPFEDRFYRRHGVPAVFVGHPLLDDPDLPLAPVAPAEGPTVGLLPGSRDREIARHLPLMLEAAHQLVAVRPREGLRFLVSVAGAVDPAHVASIVAAHPGPARFGTVPGGARRVFSRCALVVAVSGTVTLEAAIAGVPAVIIYRVSPLSYWLGRLLIRVRHISLANLIFGRPLLPELIQDAATPEAIAETAGRMLDAPDQLNGLRQRLRGIRHLLGGPGASDRVARIARSMIRRADGGQP